MKGIETNYQIELIPLSLKFPTFNKYNGDISNYMLFFPS